MQLGFIYLVSFLLSIFFFPKIGSGRTSKPLSQEKPVSSYFNSHFLLTCRQSWKLSRGSVCESAEVAAREQHIDFI